LWATKDNEQQRSQLDEASWRETKNHTNDDCAAIDHPQQQQQRRPSPLPRYDLGLGKNRPKQGEQEERRRASQPHLAAQTTTSNGVGWLTPNQTIFTAQNWMVPESVVKPLSSTTTTTTTSSSSSLGVTKIDHRPNSYTLQTAAVVVAAQQQSQSAHTSQSSSSSSSSSSQLSPLEEDNVVPQDKDSFQTIGSNNNTNTVHRVVEKQPVTTRRMVA
jgi:hypothetical protein